MNVEAKVQRIEANSAREEQRRQAAESRRSLATMSDQERMMHNNLVWQDWQRSLEDEKRKEEKRKKFIELERQTEEEK